MEKFSKLILILLVCFTMSGCLALTRAWTIATEGFTSPEGIQAGQGAAMIAEPITGEGSPLTAIIASIASLLAGGFAVYKRKQWLDTPASKSKS